MDRLNEREIGAVWIKNERKENAILQLRDKMRRR